MKRLSGRKWILCTSDTLFNGKLTIFQHKEGYRFSIDAVLLAGFTKVKPADRIVDLGTGCGVIPLVIAHRGMGAKLTGLEIQSELVDLARTNIDVNGFMDRIQIIEADFRRVHEHLPGQSFDLVTCNPPYRRLDTGRINPNRQKALARHELTASVEDAFGAAKYLLTVGGRFALIYPATRLASLFIMASKYGFGAKDLTIIYSNSSSPARLVFLECRKGGGEELKIAPAFYIYESDGVYSRAMQAFYDE